MGFRISSVAVPTLSTAKKYYGGTRQVRLDPLDEGRHTGADEAREKSRGMMRKREEKGREGESE